MNIIMIINAQTKIPQHSEIGEFANRVEARAPPRFGFPVYSSFGFLTADIF
jgi:hypothetical protein